MCAVQATTYKIHTVEQQLAEADGVMLGHYLKSQVVQLEDGSIATQMIFKMEKEYGLQSDWFGQDEVIVHYPGGKYEGLHTKIDGVPYFIGGERVALLIKTVNNRYWGLNLGLGSFKIINYGKDRLLINNAFPTEPKVSQIHLEDFETLVKKVKKTSMKLVLVPVENLPIPGLGMEVIRAPASKTQGKNRAIASTVKERENNADQTGLNNFWLIAVLAALVALYQFLRQKDVR
jgi:hypothetical protein